MTYTDSATLEREDGNRRTWTITRIVVCDAPIHDTLRAAKVDGCCCPKAAAITAHYEKQRRCGAIPKDRDALGTMRRLQALAVDGWTSTLIAEMTGLHKVTISEIRRGMKATVYGATAKKIDKAYRQLAGNAGPSKRTRSYAARFGWLPYTAWDNIDDPDEITEGSGTRRRPTVPDIDEVAVRRAVNGDPPDSITRHERREAIRQMHARGCSYDEMAMRLGTHQRMIHRDLTVLGLTGSSASDETVAS